MKNIMEKLKSILITLLVLIGSVIFIVLNIMAIPKFLKDVYFTAIDFIVNFIIAFGVLLSVSILILIAGYVVEKCHIQSKLGMNIKKNSDKIKEILNKIKMLDKNSIYEVIAVGALLALLIKQLRTDDYDNVDYFSSVVEYPYEDEKLENSAYFADYSWFHATADINFIFIQRTINHLLIIC